MINPLDDDASNDEEFSQTGITDWFFSILTGVGAVTFLLITLAVTL